jgi:SAM-dependent methyltransferase
MTGGATTVGLAKSGSWPSFPPAALAAELLQTCAAGAAVGSALELGVVARVAEGPVDPKTVAGDCGLTLQGAETLLAALAALGLFVREDDGRFRPAFSCVKDFAELLRPWGSLGLALRSEWRPADAGTTAGAECLYPDIVWQLALFFRDSAEHAAGLLMQPGARVLDIAAGAAPWSLALAARDLGCTVTAVELPGVMPTTRSAVRAVGLDGRYAFVEGSAFDVDFGERASFDLVLMANLCHLFDEQANVRLLGRVAEALRPGGTVAVIDILANEHGDGPRAAVLYALGLLLRTTRGRTYTYSTFRRWLHEGGFEDVRRRRLVGAFPLSLITARRR